MLLAVILGLAGSLATYALRPAEYTAKLTMYVSAQGGDTTQAAFQGAQLSQDRVTSYTALVTNSRVSQDVIDRLKLSETATDLSKQITATSALNSVLIDVGVTDPSPDRASLLANTVGQVFTALVAELERPVQVGGAPAVAVRVVQPAATPTVPSSTGLAVTLTLGLLVGLAVGVAGAFGRNALDSTVKSLDQLRANSGAPNLGNIAFDAEVPQRPLTLHEDPQSPRSEAFRQLRTNLQFVDIDQPRKVIVVTSSMPTEGKTTTMVNLAIAMASAGNRVLVIEADLRRPMASKLLGLDGAVGLTSILSGRVRTDQAIQSWGGGILDVLGSGPLPPNPSELLASKQMNILLQELRTSYSAILIDTPPLLPVTDAAAVAPAADGVILVCRYRQTTRHQLEMASNALRSVSAKLLGTVFTMVPNAGPGAYAQYNSYYRSDTAASSAPTSSSGRPFKGRSANSATAQRSGSDTPGQE